MKNTKGEKMKGENEKNKMKSNNTNPLVSIIITTRNSDRTIDKCLNSIKEQSYKNTEIIVVDNNSTDGTKEIK